MSRHLTLGKEGERHAAVFLEAKGHVILETNYRFERKEIDIISLHGDVLVFTEIKARSSYDFGFPEEAVSVRKQQYLKVAAEYYCNEHPQYNKQRFDVISILVQGKEVRELVHFEDAFY